MSGGQDRNMLVISASGLYKVRVQDINGNLWFLAKDICQVLGVDNVSDACGTLDADERNTIVSTDGIRGNPNTLVINVSGLYSRVMRSSKPEACEFVFPDWIMLGVEDFYVTGALLVDDVTARLP